MIQVYTGSGKGKTTAALGLALRALGAGKKVLLIQFLKDGKSSEIKSGRKYRPDFKIRSFGQKGFVDKNKLKKRDADLAQKGFVFFKKAVQSRIYDLIILDEINVAVTYGLLERGEISLFLSGLTKDQEIILTGREAPKEFVQIADLVTEMREIKHYYKQGTKARKGIEF